LSGWNQRLVTLAAAAIATVSSPALAATCEPATLATEVESLPPAWRSAIEALVRATSHEGHPWSCHGSRVALRLGGPDGPARLTVTLSDGSALERVIASPDDVVPVGEALLARPLERVPSPAVAPLPEPDAALFIFPAPGGEARRERPEEPRGEPRLLIDVLASTRYSGAALWAGGAMRASLPFDRWSVGFWGRFEAAVAELKPVPFDFLMWSGSVGLSAGYRVLLRRVELTAAFDPSVAIVSMDGGYDTPTMSASGAKADLRLGGRLQGAIPLSAAWRGLFALDGELGPMAMTSAHHRIIDPRLPPIPTFTLGASLGGELALR